MPLAYFARSLALLVLYGGCHNATATESFHKTSAGYVREMIPYQVRVVTHDAAGRPNAVYVTRYRVVYTPVVDTLTLWR